MSHQAVASECAEFLATLGDQVQRLESSVSRVRDAYLARRLQQRLADAETAQSLYSGSEEREFHAARLAIQPLVNGALKSALLHVRKRHGNRRDLGLWMSELRANSEALRQVANETIETLLAALPDASVATPRQSASLGLSVEQANAMLQFLEDYRTIGYDDLREDLVRFFGGSPQFFSDWMSRLRSVDLNLSQDNVRMIEKKVMEREKPFTLQELVDIQKRTGDQRTLPVMLALNDIMVLERIAEIEQARQIVQGRIQYLDRLRTEIRGANAKSESARLTFEIPSGAQPSEIVEFVSAWMEARKGEWSDSEFAESAVPSIFEGIERYGTKRLSFLQWVEILQVIRSHSAAFQITEGLRSVVRRQYERVIERYHVRGTSLQQRIESFMSEYVQPVGFVGAFLTFFPAPLIIWMAGYSIDPAIYWPVFGGQIALGALGGWAGEDPWTRQGGRLSRLVNTIRNRRQIRYARSLYQSVLNDPWGREINSGTPMSPTREQLGERRKFYTEEDAELAREQRQLEEYLRGRL